MGGLLCSSSLSFSLSCCAVRHFWEWRCPYTDKTQAPLSSPGVGRERERERESFSPPYSLPLFSLIFSLLHPAASLCVFGGGFRRRRTTNTFTKVGGVVIGRETTPSCVQVRRKKEKNNNQEDCVCVSFRTTHQLPLFFSWGVVNLEGGGGGKAICDDSLGEFPLAWTIYRLYREEQ